jgi:hypothetical protein
MMTTTMTKQHQQSIVDNDGNDAKGGDSDGNDGGDGNGVGNGDDTTTAANGNNVNDDNGSNSRMEIGQQQLYNGNGTTTM